MITNNFLEKIEEEAAEYHKEIEKAALDKKQKFSYGDWKELHDLLNAGFTYEESLAILSKIAK